MNKLGVLGTAALLFACHGSSSPSPTGDGGSPPPPTGWRAAVGAGGTLVQTFDEHTWSMRSSLGVDLFAVTCVGNLKGWAVGQGGAVMHTEDGGQTWAPEQSNLVAALRGVHFSDALHGVIAGDGGALARTEDGGQSWTPIATTSSDLGAVAATTSGEFFVASAGGSVLHSTDFGRSFSPVAIAGAADVVAIASDADGTLVFAGDGVGHVFASTDGAASFHLETTAPAAIASIASAGQWGGSGWGGVSALAVGDGGVVLLRASDGVWAASNAGTTANLRAALVTDTYSYVAGEGGTLLALEGNVWTPITTNTTQALYGLDDL